VRSELVCSLVAVALWLACAAVDDPDSYATGSRGGAGSTPPGGTGNAGSGQTNADAGDCFAPTCASMFANCGEVRDPCGGTISCGECPAGLICGGDGSNRCGTNGCTPITCGQIGAACGVVSDQCSGILDCGGCTAPMVCSAENTCTDPNDPDSGGSGGSTSQGGSGAAAGQGPAESCSDGDKNGLETDVDCGGGACPACGLGKACGASADCSSKTCVSSSCVSCSWTGWKIPSAASSVGGSSKSWYTLNSSASLATALRADDSTYAVYDVLANSDSETLRSTGYSAGIPAGAIIKGIQVQVLRETSGTVTNRDKIIQLVRGGARIGVSRGRTTVHWPAAPDNFQWATYGGQDDLWGGAWSASAINDSTFGFDVVTHNYYGSAASTAYVDKVQLRVYFCAVS
jgi:hypothetical protein